MNAFKVGEPISPGRHGEPAPTPEDLHRIELEVIERNKMSTAQAVAKARASVPTDATAAEWELAGILPWLPPRPRSTNVLPN